MYLVQAQNEQKCTGEILYFEVWGIFVVFVKNCLHVSASFAVFIRMPTCLVPRSRVKSV